MKRHPPQSNHTRSRRQAGARARIWRRSGFSLVEVLVAILILGVALAGLTTAITTALGSSKESELQATAAMIAAGRIETVRAEGFIEDGFTESEPGTNSLYRWTQTISSADIEGLYEVNVTVEHAKTGQLIFELETLLFEPPMETTPEEERRSRNSRGTGGARQ